MKLLILYHETDTDPRNLITLLVVVIQTESWTWAFVTSTVLSSERKDFKNKVKFYNQPNLTFQAKNIMWHQTPLSGHLMISYSLKALISALCLELLFLVIKSMIKDPNVRREGFK